MTKKFTVRLKKADENDLFEISLKSSIAKGKELFIFEKSELGNIVNKDKAEKLRSNFLKNKIKVKQITNC